jgi:hypothetical protein
MTAHNPATKRELPQPGEKWRHFKGGEYWVIAIAHYSAIYFDDKAEVVVYAKDWIDILNELASGFNFIAQDTETGDLYEVTKESDKWYLRPAVNPITYKVTERKPIAWACPLDNFMSMAGDGYRFVVTEPSRSERMENPPLVGEGGVKCESMCEVAIFQ